MLNRLRTCLLGVLALLCIASASQAGPLIRLQAKTFDPTASTSKVSNGSTARNKLASGAVAAVSTSDYKIVQFVGPIKPAWRNALKRAGATIVGYLPDYAYTVKMDSNTEATVRSIKGINWVGPYIPQYKYNDNLASIPASKLLDMTIILFPNEDASIVSNTLKDMGLTVTAISNSPGKPFVVINSSTAALSFISQIDAVKWVEFHHTIKLHNNITNSISKVTNVRTSIGLYGNGEIIGIADTGLSTGNASTLHADLKDRLQKAYALGRTNDWSDINAHGTHVAGSAVGTGKLSGGSAANKYNTGFSGAAPEAKLVFQSVEDSDGALTGIPKDISELFAQAYNDGARIHSDSWGYECYGAYDMQASQLDGFVWDHKDMVICVSAGNEGIDADSDGVVDYWSMSSPAVAKNCIAVGATESLRASGGLQGGWGMFLDALGKSRYPVAPISKDLISDNPEEVTPFSSRGPCWDYRVKPDLVAPGSNIVSCASSLVDYTNPDDPRSWGVYDANYVYMGGTSMSCPHVAGTAALVREFLRTKKSISTPSAALVKATFINGTKDLTPGAYGTGDTQQIIACPDYNQGWGRLDLATSLTSPVAGDLQFVDFTTGIKTGENQTYTFNVGEGNILRFTMAYTDYPAEENTVVATVNNLDIVVSNPKGKKYYANGGSAPDEIAADTVEDVKIPSATSIDGVYTVVVSGKNVTTDESQPFALVARVTPGTPDISGSTMTSNPPETCWPGDVITYTINVTNPLQPTTNAKITDAIPANTTYVAGSTTLNGTPVADSAGICPLVSGMLINTPGYNAGVVRRAGPAVVTFQVRVNNGLAEGTPLVNICNITADGLTQQRTVNMRTPLIRRVAIGGTGDGSSWNNAAPSVTAVVSGLLSGDEIWVSKGTYSGTYTTHNGVSLYGGFSGNETSKAQRNPTLNPTILDGKYGRSVVTFGAGTELAVIDGFTVKNGRGDALRSGSQTVYCGGAVCADKSPVIINNNIFTGNIVKSRGGAIYCTGTTAVITNNQFSANSARDTETSNYNGFGGGVYCASTSVVITNNKFTSCNANPYGGAIYANRVSTTVITNNTITGCGAMTGGAIYCEAGSAPVITNNFIIGNTATNAGGIYVGLNSTASIIGNTIVKNTASPGGGIGVYSASPTIVNNIVALNSTGIAKLGTGTLIERNNCVFKNLTGDYYGLTAGIGDISKDPLFVSTATSDYHIKTGSPCIDAGDDTVVQGTDIDGAARIQGTHVDIGCDEKQ